MKGSDSTNSLTELTGRDECFICIATENEKGEPLVSSKLLRTCGCKFFVHPACWNEWLKGKSDYDCPICRRESITRIPFPPNPVLFITIPPDEEETRHVRILYRARYKILSFCLLLAFALAIFFSLVHGD
jgi:hypothetical protein